MNNSQTIVINESNLNTGIVHKEQAAIHGAYSFHKIFVQNATKFNREFVLQTIMQALHPLDFIPVGYTVEDEYVTFLLKNCGKAITKMCALNLVIPHSDQQNQPPFKLAVELNHAKASEFKIDIQSNIMSVLQRRYNSTTKVLNLEYFMHDSALIEFCPLSQHKLLYFVLYLTKDFEIEHLKLSGNKIETLRSLDAFGKNPAGKFLKILDISRNKISDKAELEYIKHYAIEEVLLYENPICSTVSEVDYVKILKNVCPSIQKIDNVELSNIGSTVIKRNFLCDPKGKTFVELFIEHYFTLYDSPNRELLAHMYHKNAMFSMTTNYTVFSKESRSLSRLYLYKQMSRNLLTLSDMSKGHENLTCGYVEIAKRLKTLPATEHDFCSFTVDLLNLSQKDAILTLNGVFKEPGQSLLESEYFYSFTRTFIMQSTNSMDFVITNDMLHITHATQKQQLTSFKVVKVPRSTIGVSVARSQTEKNEMINAFVSITHMLPEWSIKCLKETDFNFQKALILFRDLFKADKIPIIAFDDISSEAPTPVVTTSQALQQNAEIKRKLPANDQNKIQIPPTQNTKAPVISSTVALQSGLPKKKKKQPSENLKQVNTVKTPVTLSIPAFDLTTNIDHQSQKQQSASSKATLSMKPQTANVQETSIPKTLDLADFVNSSLTINSASQVKNTPITINLQKNKPRDNAEGIDVNIGDLRKYVKDTIIITVLDMTAETPIDVVKANLERAAKQVLSQYTFALKYYKAIGREFYRFKLYSDARTFLTNAMATVPKNMGEQLYCIFTLFEIQYGEANIAENMVLMISESFEIRNAATFLGKELPKTNATYARKVFGMIATSDLANDKKHILLEAYIEFEKEFGTVENLKYAQKVLQDCINGVPDEKAPEGANQCVESNQVTGGAKKSIVLPFEEFRYRLLANAGILPMEVAREELEQFRKLTDKLNVEQVGEGLLSKYSSNMYVIRAVCKKWQMHQNVEKAAQVLRKMQEDSPNESQKLNSLVLYLKVREDLNNNNINNAKDKLKRHITISTFVQIIQVCEDLMEDAIDNSECRTFLQSVLEEFVHGKKTHKTQLLILLYTSLCKKFQLNDADTLYLSTFNQLKHFHPDDVLELESVKQRRLICESGLPPKKKLEEWLDSFKFARPEESIDEMRMYYYFKIPDKARRVRNLYIQANKGQNCYDLRVASAFYEALYAKPSVGLKQVRAGADVNIWCVKMLCFYKLNAIKDLEKIAQCLLSDIYSIINPYTQELIYKYYKDFIAEGFDFLDGRFCISELL